MHGPQIKKQIFLLTYQLDCCEDLNAIVGIQRQIEEQIDILVSLTGKPRAAIEMTLDHDYPAWAQARARRSAEGSEGDQN